jgi:histidine ammonia-lyase
MAALRIGDEPLTPAAVAAAARSGPVEVELSPAARERIAAARAAADAAVGRRQLYGRTTGVGANRDTAVQVGGREHALALLRSHAAGLGAPLPAEAVRAALLVRLNQMAAGGGGHRPELADALVALLQDESLPVLRDLGGIGTGDLTVLAQLGLVLERSGVEFAKGDALPLISSNAVTLGVAALALADLRELLEAGLGVTAATFRAIDGNREAFAEAVAAARPHPGLVAVTRTLWALTAGAGPPARLQDPFGLRCLPPVAGALHGALDALQDVVRVEIGAAPANPLFADGEVWHHGGFHAAPIALALDAARLALVPYAQLSTARLGHLMEPALTGLAPFLATGPAGSSGLLIAEYVAADALARLRAEAAPAVTGTAVISRGLEEHASFAWQGALQARGSVEHLGTVLALELAAAQRALALRDVPPPAALEGVLVAEAPAPVDVPIDADVGRAQALLPRLAAAVRAAR